MADDIWQRSGGLPNWQEISFDMVIDLVTMLHFGVSGKIRRRCWLRCRETLRTEVTGDVAAASVRTGR
jgi:hypothetical protein